VQSLFPREKANDSVTSLFEDAFQLYAQVAGCALDKQTSELKRMIGPGNVLKKWCDAVNAALTVLAREVIVADVRPAASKAVSEIRKESFTDSSISHH
jgi:hypothetical protein